MTHEMSRRTVLGGMGAGALLALSPETLVAGALRPLRTIEACFGPRRMARIAAICQGAPVREDLNWVFGAPGERRQMLDDAGRFKMVPEYREAMTLAANGYAPVTFSLSDESWHRCTTEEVYGDTVYALARFMGVRVPSNLRQHFLTREGRCNTTFHGPFKIGGIPI